MRCGPRNGARSRCRRRRARARWRCRCATPGAAFPPSGCRACSSVSCRCPAPRRAARAWGWRFPSTSCARTAATSACGPSRAGARSSRSRSPRPPDVAKKEVDMRILVVDDEEPLRKMVRLTLEAAGYEVGEARDGEQAFEAWSRHGPWDAVLLDQRLPGMDGVEVLRRLRGQDPAACVVMVTAYASIDLAVEAMKLGATDFLRKPMTPETLRGAVAGALARRGAPPAPREARPIETLTMNGYSIVRAGSSESEHRYRVRRYPIG